MEKALTPISTRGIFSRPRGEVSGFTLIELALVLLIISLTAAIVFPRLPSLTRPRLQSSSRRLAALITYLHEEAALRGRVYRLTLDLDRGVYEVAVRPAADPTSIDQDFVHEWDPYARGAGLPEEVSFRSLTTPTGEESHGRHDLYFRPQGSSLPATIVMGSGDGDASLSINGVTGRVDVETSP